MTEGLIALVVLCLMVAPLPIIEGSMPISRALVDEVRETWLLGWAPVLIAVSLGEALLAGFVAMLALGAARIHTWDVSFSHTRQLTAWLAFLAALVAMLRAWDGGTVWLLRMITLAGAANGAFAALQRLGWVPTTQPDLWGLRFVLRRAIPDLPNYEGLCGQSNTLGMWAAITMPASIALTRWDGPGWVAATLAIAVGLWLSRSRLGAFALALGTVPTLHWLGWMPWPALIAIGLLGCAAIGTYPGGWAWGQFRAGGLEEVFRTDRWTAWRKILQVGFTLPEGLPRFAHWWIFAFGRGSRAYDYLCGYTIKDDSPGGGLRYNRAHNEWLEVLVEHGGAGVGLAMALVGSLSWRLWPFLGHPLAAGTAGALAALLASSLAFFPFKSASALLPVIGTIALLLGGQWR